MDAEAVRQLALLIPLCTIAAGIFIAAIKMRPANKTADAAIVDGHWTRFQGEIKRLDERIAVLEREVETCHRERDEARADALKWKAIAEGIGQNRQEEATLLAAERLAERVERKK